MSRPSLGTEEIVALAAADPELRILRRAVAPHAVSVPRGTLLLSCCALEGMINESGDRLRDLSLRPFRADERGVIVDAGSPRRWTAPKVLARTFGTRCEPACDAERRRSSPTRSS